MTAILKNIQMAWLGWKNYTDDGKLAALLLAALLFLWYYRKKTEKLSFLGYTIVVTICCIVPVTAGLLMWYQTGFYGYEWIWSLVPMTAAIAYGVTFFLSECWNGSAEAGGNLPEGRGRMRLAHWRRGIPATALLLAVIMLSGGMGRPSWNRKETAVERERAYVVLDQIAGLCPEGNICLWAPREIMSYAREYDGRILLPYGRNMWDISLNAYSYDVYDQQTIALYEWMEQAGNADDGNNTQTLDADAMGAAGVDAAFTALEVCIRYAQDAGVDCVVLPETASSETIQRMETALHTKARLSEGYWIFYERAD